MAASVSITLTEDLDIDLVVLKKDGSPQPLDEGGTWVLLMHGRNKATDTGAAVIDLTSANAAQILIDADQTTNPGVATAFIVNAVSVGLSIDGLVFDIIAIDPSNNKRRFLITGGRIVVKRDVGNT